MMNTIVDEKLISFKELEKKVFEYVCKLGCEITKRYWSPMTKSCLPKGIRKNIVIKEPAEPV